MSAFLRLLAVVALIAFAACGPTPPPAPPIPPPTEPSYQECLRLARKAADKRADEKCPPAEVQWLECKHRQPLMDQYKAEQAECRGDHG
jgi:hypothetical protein